MRPASISPNRARRPNGAAGISPRSISPSLIRTAPAIHVRNGRIHFKFGDTKSVFYLTETDLDVSARFRRRLEDFAGGAGPRARTARRRAWDLSSFNGRWYADPGRVDMDLAIDRTALGEVTALLERPGRRRSRHAHFAHPPRRSAEQHGDHRPARYQRRASLGPDAGQRPGMAARISAGGWT